MNTPVPIAARPAMTVTSAMTASLFASLFSLTAPSSLQADGSVHRFFASLLLDIADAPK